MSATRTVFIAISLTVATSHPVSATVKDFAAFFDKHCADCHDAETKKGKLDLSALKFEPANAENFERWVKLHDLVQDGEMPPKDKKRPPADDTKHFLDSLSTELSAADRAQQAGEGRALFRRLTRVEYENTLRDLLALPGLQVMDMLPGDGTAHGFDKVGSALDMSHVQLAKYMEAADKALEAAIAWMPHKPEVYSARHYPGAEYDFKIVLTNSDAVTLRNKKHDPWGIPLLGEGEHSKLGLRELEQVGTFPYRGAIGVFRHEDCAFRPRFANFAPVYAGFYKVRLSLWSFWWDKGEVKPSPKMEGGWLKADSSLIGYFDAPSLNSKVTEATVWLESGDYITFNAASLIPIRVSETKGHTKEYQGPGIAIDWMEVEGPIVEQWPPASHKRLFGELPLEPFDTKSGVRPPPRSVVKQSKPGAFPRPLHFQKDEPKLWSVASKQPVEDARRLLADFIKRAFRRPVPGAEVERYIAIFNERITANKSFEEAMRAAYRAVLCSPDFLFLREPRGTLDDWAVAARLSYFLWNTTPDDTLLALAEKGALQQPATLRAQAERMLNDPKAERFITNFLDQWLNLKDIDQTTPDKQLYPDFSPCLQDAMVAETRLFFTEMLKKNLGVQNIITSDFSMLNQKLAEHYGIAGVDGFAETKKVSLTADMHRGGLLTQASVLKVTANGTVTTPVKRGAWVMEKIIGKPIPPPPPDIPAIDPDTRGTTTIREQLDKHRHDPVCASCHSKMDPPGFALESFDVIGGFRTRYRSLGEGDKVDKVGNKRLAVKYKDALPVDCAGALPDGTVFKGIDDLRVALLKNPDQIARNLARQLVIYATGADVSFSDRAEIEKIVGAVRKENYGARSLIHEIVQSPLFLRK